MFDMVRYAFIIHKLPNDDTCLVLMCFERNTYYKLAVDFEHKTKSLPRAFVYILYISCGKMAPVQVTSQINDLTFHTSSYTLLFYTFVEDIPSTLWTSI
jgi:hypothetical protein